MVAPIRVQGYSEANLAHFELYTTMKNLRNKSTKAQAYLSYFCKVQFAFSINKVIVITSSMKNLKSAVALKRVVLFANCPHLNK